MNSAGFKVAPKALGFFAMFSIAVAQHSSSPAGHCNSWGGDDAVARTPLSANLAAEVKNKVTTAFSGLAIDVDKFRQDLSKKLKEYEDEQRSKSGFDILKFRDKKAEAYAELNRKLNEASIKLANKVSEFGEGLGKKIESSINERSPKLVGLAQYEHCLDPCRFQDGVPGWSHVGKLHIDGVNAFDGDFTIKFGPIPIEISFSIPGFAEFSFKVEIGSSFSGALKGSFAPDEPSSIKPRNKPSGKSSALIDFPITGVVSVTSSTGLIGAEGELGITHNKLIGPLDLSYTAQDNCQQQHK